MLFVNNNSDSKLTKIVSIIFVISAIIGLFCQIMSILALTRTKLGKLVRHNVIGIMYDAFDESIDEASKRMPEWEEKLNKLG